MVPYALILTLLLISSAGAAIRYVDKDNACPGTGATGTPYCSIANGVSGAVAGDEIRIRNAASAYNECVNVSSSGSAGNYIEIEPDVGHTPTITPTCEAGTRNAAIDIVNHSFWRIQGLTFGGGAGNTPLNAIRVVVSGTSGVAGNVEILNNTFTNWSLNTSYNDQVVMGPVGTYSLTDNRLVSNVRIEGNTFTNSRGSAIAVSSCNNCIVRSNKISRIRCGLKNGQPMAWGIRTEERATSSTTGNNGLIEFNEIWDFDTRGQCAADFGGLTTGNTAGIYCDVKPSGWRVRYNRLHDTDTNNTINNVRGIFVEALCKDWIVEHNIVSQWGGAGLYTRDNRGPVTFRRNTVYDSGCTEMFISGVSSQAYTAIIEGNLFWHTNTASNCYLVHANNAVAVAAVQANNNLYYSPALANAFRADATISNFTNWKANTGEDAASLLTDPGLRNPGADNFNYTASGAGRNACGSVGSFLGAGADCGAFEPPITLTCQTLDSNTDTCTTSAQYPPIALVAGLTPKEDGNTCTASNITITGAGSFTYDVSGAGDCSARDSGDTLTLAFADQFMSDSILIGGTGGLRGQSTGPGEVAVTNNLGGGAGPSYSMTNAGIYRFSFPVNNEEKACAINTECPLYAGAKAILRGQIAVSTANAPSRPYEWRCDDGSGFYLVTGASSGLVSYVDDPGNMGGTVLSSEALPLGGDTFAACGVLYESPDALVSCGANSGQRLEYAASVQVSPDATLATQITCRLEADGGVDLNSYANPVQIRVATPEASGF